MFAINCCLQSLRLTDAAVLRRLIQIKTKLLLKMDEPLL
jgi:hypothetical protein